MQILWDTDGTTIMICRKIMNSDQKKKSKYFANYTKKHPMKRHFLSDKKPADSPLFTSKDKIGNSLIQIL